MCHQWSKAENKITVPKSQVVGGSRTRSRSRSWSGSWPLKAISTSSNGGISKGSRLRDRIPPAFPGPAPGSPPRWTYLKLLPREEGSQCGQSSGRGVQVHPCRFLSQMVQETLTLTFLDVLGCHLIQVPVDWCSSPPPG